ncbi:hypothetical protein T484DRAFT_1919709, partial [Baffinella frigidus]
MHAATSLTFNAFMRSRGFDTPGGTPPRVGHHGSAIPSARQFACCAKTSVRHDAAAPPCSDFSIAGTRDRGVDIREASAIDSPGHTRGRSAIEPAPSPALDGDGRIVTTSSARSEGRERGSAISPGGASRDSSLRDSGVAGGVVISAEVRWEFPVTLDLNQDRLPFALQEAFEATAEQLRSAQYNLRHAGREFATACDVPSDPLGIDPQVLSSLPLKNQIVDARIPASKGEAAEWAAQRLQ